jgi:hypothetical protein
MVRATIVKVNESDAGAQKGVGMHVAELNGEEIKAVLQVCRYHVRLEETRLMVDGRSTSGFN